MLTKSYRFITLFLSVNISFLSVILFYFKISYFYFYNFLYNLRNTQKTKFREKPLALYVLCNSQKTIDLFKTQTSSGGFCSNDLLNHFAGIKMSYMF